MKGKEKRAGAFCAFLAAAVWLAVSVLIPSAGSAGESQAQIHMMNDLLQYVYQCELMFTDMQWVLEGVERFDRERNWGNLREARARIMVAEHSISAMMLPEADMTAAEEMELMSSGIEADFMEILPGSFDQNKISMLNGCDILRNAMMMDVFLTEDWEIALRIGDSLRQLTDWNVRYLANTVDWTLASVADEAVTEAFDALLAEYCPQTFSFRRKELPTPEEIENETVPLLDELDALTLDYSGIIGMRKNRIERLRESISGPELIASESGILSVADLPPIVFLPEWYSTDDVLYYWKENGEVIGMPLRETAPERAPDGCRIRIPKVSREDLKAYMSDLIAAGFEVDYTEKGDGLFLFCQWDGSSFSLDWQDGTVTILLTDHPLCFVPVQYYRILISRDD